MVRLNVFARRRKHCFFYDWNPRKIVMVMVYLTQVIGVLITLIQDVLKKLPSKVVVVEVAY